MSEKPVTEEEIRDTVMKTEDTAFEDSVADTEKETETAETEPPKQSPLQEFLDWAVPYVVVCVIAVAFFLCFRIVNVSGSSMNNTYQEGDTVIVNAAFYQGSDRGDIVVINAVENNVPIIIKRVIAVGGDEIDIDFESGNVTLNGTTLEEPYIKEPTTTDYGGFTYPVTVPDGYYFVMGDNRNNSIDSRHSSIGFVAEEDIMGNVIFKLPF